MVIMMVMIIDEMQDTHTKAMKVTERYMSNIILFTGLLTRFTVITDTGIIELS